MTDNSFLAALPVVRRGAVVTWLDTSIGDCRALLTSCPDSAAHDRHESGLRHLCCDGSQPAPLGDELS
jgi:hypothetical protein